MTRIPFGHANSLASENCITLMGRFLTPSSTRCWEVLVNKDVKMDPEGVDLSYFSL